MNPHTIPRTTYLFMFNDGESLCPARSTCSTESDAVTKLLYGLGELGQPEFFHVLPKTVPDSVWLVEDDVPPRDVTNHLAAKVFARWVADGFDPDPEDGDPLPEFCDRHLRESDRRALVGEAAEAQAPAEFPGVGRG